MKRLLFSLAALLAVVSCQGEPVGNRVTPGGKEQPQDTPPEAPAGYKTVPLQAQVTQVQPMTGIVLWAESSAVRKPWVQLEFAYMLYNDVCKKEGEFDWTPMERLLENVASRGHQAVVRFRYTYVGKSCAVPDYIKARDDYEPTWGKSENRNTEFPDWRCEELRRFHMEFHRRFAEKYDHDPRLAFVETGFGLWAEYHIYDGPFIPGQTFPSKEFQAEFLRAMDGWFTATPWCISIDAADSKYAPFHQDATLLELNFGNFDDSFMCEDHDGYNTRSWRFFGEERYKKAPLGGEFSYYSNDDQKHCLDKKGMYGRTFESEAAKFHMTFIIGNDQPRMQSDARLQEAAMSMGYRFKIKDFQIKEGEGAVVEITNVGVAPIYREAYVAVNGIRGEYSLKALMPGQTQRISIASATLKPEGAVLTIECDHLVTGQTIEYEADIQ